MHLKLSSVFLLLLASACTFDGADAVFLEGDGGAGQMDSSADQADGSPDQTEFYFEAEAATLSPEMTVASDTFASQGQFVETSKAWAGTMTFTLNDAEMGEYIIWARVWTKSTTPAALSFFVSLDGADQDIFDPTPGTWSDSWRWTRVSGRDGTSEERKIDPRIFQLTQGSHTITFGGRELNVGLDRIIITNDQTFTPQ